MQTAQPTESSVFTFGIAVDDTNVYWAENNGTVMQVSKAAPPSWPSRRDS